MAALWYHYFLSRLTLLYLDAHFFTATNCFWMGSSLHEWIHWQLAWRLETSVPADNTFKNKLSVVLHLDCCAWSINWHHVIVFWLALNRIIVCFYHLHKKTRQLYDCFFIRHGFYSWWVRSLKPCSFLKHYLLFISLFIHYDIILIAFLIILSTRLYNYY